MIIEPGPHPVGWVVQALQIGIFHCVARCGETGLHTLRGSNYTAAQWFTLAQAHTICTALSAQY